MNRGRHEEIDEDVQRWIKKRGSKEKRKSSEKKERKRGRGGKIEEEPRGCRDKVWGGCVA
jgi:hypothetical protein